MFAYDVATLEVAYLNGFSPNLSKISESLVDLTADAAIDGAINKVT